MIPRKITQIPTSGSATFITALSAVSKAPLVISGSFPVKPPTTTATTTKASQIQFSIARDYALPRLHLAISRAGLLGGLTNLPKVTFRPQIDRTINHGWRSESG